MKLFIDFRSNLINKRKYTLSVYKIDKKGKMKKHLGLFIFRSKSAISAFQNELNENIVVVIVDYLNPIRRPIGLKTGKKTMYCPYCTQVNIFVLSKCPICWASDNNYNVRLQNMKRG